MSTPPAPTQIFAQVPTLIGTLASNDTHIGPQTHVLSQTSRQRPSPLATRLTQAHTLHKRTDPQRQAFSRKQTGTKTLARPGAQPRPGPAHQCRCACPPSRGSRSRAHAATQWRRGVLPGAPSRLSPTRPGGHVREKTKIWLGPGRWAARKGRGRR